MALNSAVAVTAAELTATQVANVLVQPLEAQSQFLSAGPRIFDTAGPLRIPKMADPTNPSWHGESELITEVNPDFNEVSLLPSTMKSIKTLTRYSNELARQSVISLDAALRQRLVTDVAAALDTQLFGAGGDGTLTPKGIFNYSGIQTLPVAGAITLDGLLDAWALAMAANVNTGSLKWVMRSREFIKLRKVKDLQNRYQLQPDPTQDGVFRLFGAPVVITNRVPDTTGATPTARVGLVDFSQVAVARDLAPSVKFLTETYGNYDQQAIRVVARYDAAPLNAQAVVAHTRWNGRAWTSAGGERTRGRDIRQTAVCSLTAVGSPASPSDGRRVRRSRVPRPR